MQYHACITRLLFVLVIVLISVLLISNDCITEVYAENGQVDNETGGQIHDETQQHAGDNKIVLSSKAKSNLGLKTAEADLHRIEKVVQVTGNIIAHPGRQAVVTPRIGGIVKRIHFNLGDAVKKGDVLLELESLDLQLAEIDLIEAVDQQKSLEVKLAKQKSVFAKQIRLELRTRQIDYLESLAEQQQQKAVYLKHRSLAITKTVSALERMRVDLIKADVERKLLENTLRRIESLTEMRISAQKELVAQRANYTKATNTFTGIKRQFQLLGVNDQLLQMILDDTDKTPILTVLQSDGNADGNVRDTDESKSVSSGDGHIAMKYVSLIEEASSLVDAESAYSSAEIKVHANKQRALAAGLIESQLQKVKDTGKIAAFNDVTTDTLIDQYAPFMTSSEALEALLQTEEAQRNADIVLAKVKRKLRVFGMTADEIDNIVQTGKIRSAIYVTAPSSGTVINQDVTLGATVDKSSTLFSILDTGIVWIEGEAYEDTLPLFHKKWHVGTEVRVRVPAYPELVFTGKISQISAVANPEKRTVHFWTEVDNSNQQLKPGMFADQTLVIEELDDVLSVPLSAVVEDGVTQVVFVESNNSYLKHEVKVGVKDDRYVEIKEGLLAGELVVIQGTHQLMRATAGTTIVDDPHAGHNH